MRLSSISLVAGLVALASAQMPDVADLPTCAQSCVGSSLNVEGCTGLDVECICSNNDFLVNIACCVAEACPQEGQDKTLEFARGICATAGVEISDDVICSTAAEPGSSDEASSASEDETESATGDESSSDSEDETSTEPATDDESASDSEGETSTESTADDESTSASADETSTAAGTASPTAASSTDASPSDSSTSASATVATVTENAANGLSSAGQGLGLFGAAAAALFALL